MENLSFCKLSYRTFKRLNSCEFSDFGFPHPAFLPVRSTQTAGHPLPKDRV